ncbi:glycosyltransferase [Bifidobacterium vansinderenii]|uniref:Glycosyl transferase family 2 n=1 Tax=Bifidobacterium vansinderenii TaxID=1984871 RepID=A0A229W021_9BIFI|nr:glycosyltransferase [Bifidobacterium vansinderenii]OXN01201.1 glycosyl transferase family 2 [Bifidobacterium vansinderenii]
MSLNSEPKVSIIVPVYNVSDYLNPCVSSIVGQTYDNLQIILVDDGSTDGSAAICDEWAAKDSRVEVVHQSNAGVSAARNAGLEKAAGEYVLFVDGDDTLDANAVSTVVSCARTGDYQIVFFSNTVDQSEHGELKSQRRNHMTPFGVTSNEEFRRKYAELSRNEYVCPPWNKLFSADLIRQVGATFPEDVRYGEDLVFDMPLYVAAERVALVDVPLYHYIARDGSAQSTFNPKWFASRRRAYELLRPVAQRWDESVRNECDNQTVLEVDRVINALYGPQRVVRGRRRRDYVRMVANDSVMRDCVSEIKPVDKRRAIVSQLIRWRSAWLLRLYGWAVATVKSIRPAKG